MSDDTDLAAASLLKKELEKQEGRGGWVNGSKLERTYLDGCFDLVAIARAMREHFARERIIPPA